MPLLLPSSFFAWSGQVDWLLPGAFNRIRAISVAAKLDVRMRLSRKQNSCFQLKSGVAPSADLWTVKMLKKFLIEKLPTYIPRLHSTKEITRTQKKGRCHVWSCPTYKSIDATLAFQHVTKLLFSCRLAVISFPIPISLYSFGLYYGNR